MLRIINTLKPFIEDNYIELGVREYAKIAKITPPTASKTLKQLESIGILKKRQYRNILLFRANRESWLLRDLSRIYWKENLNNLINYLISEFRNPTIILFGSLAKLETKKESDIDLAIISKLDKKLELYKYEQLYKREIQIFEFQSINKINKELGKNILNGYIISGEL